MTAPTQYPEPQPYRVKGSGGELHAAARKSYVPSTSRLSRS